MRIAYYCAMGAVAALCLPVAYVGGSAVASSLPSFVQHNVSVSTFDAIHASGYFTVVIVNSRSAKQPAVKVAGYSFEPIQVRVHHHTLYLQSPGHPVPGFNHREIVTVYTDHLEGLTVAGPTNVRGLDIYSNGLMIQSSGTGNILLRGKIQLNRIQQSGDNRINIRWVDSGMLYVNSTGRGSIHLAGVSNVLYARLRGHASLNAQYLRTHDVQVQTKNQSAASVCPTHTLRAFAFDHSNVYYYKYPKNITQYSAQSGNVLQMAWHQ